jgi:hypothetical protein
VYILASREKWICSGENASNKAEAIPTLLPNSLPIRYKIGIHAVPMIAEKARIGIAELPKINLQKCKTTK